MAEELRRIPINEETVSIASFALWFNEVQLDKELILNKNEQYGDSWQAEGPFLAASRMKDKITRVSTITAQIMRAVSKEENASGLVLEEKSLGAVSETMGEGFQDILEMMAYGKLLMLYWVYNGFGLGGSTLASVNEVYEFIERELKSLDDHVPDATG